MPAAKHNPARIRGLTPKVEEHLPELRANLTPQEQILWSALRGRKLDGVKFRRQHPLGPFVLDFYAPEVRLVVELDGDVHDEPSQRARDQRRDAHLTANGYRVVRVANMEVVLDLDAVVGRLTSVIREMRGGSTLTPDPSPNPGRGETVGAVSPNPGRGE